MFLEPTARPGLRECRHWWSGTRLAEGGGNVDGKEGREGGNEVCQVIKEVDVNRVMLYGVAFHSYGFPPTQNLAQ